MVYKAILFILATANIQNKKILINGETTKCVFELVFKAF